jgi:hypothetical protein
MTNEFVEKSEQSITYSNNCTTHTSHEHRLAEAKVYAILALAKEFGRFNDLLASENGLIEAVASIGH